MKGLLRVLMTLLGQNWGWPVNILKNSKSMKCKKRNSQPSGIRADLWCRCSSWAFFWWFLWVFSFIFFYPIFYSCVWISTQKFRIWITDVIFLKPLLLRGLKNTGMWDSCESQGPWIQARHIFWYWNNNNYFQNKYKYRPSWILYILNGLLKLLLIEIMWD